MRMIEFVGIVNVDVLRYFVWEAPNRIRNEKLLESENLEKKKYR